MLFSVGFVKFMVSISQIKKIRKETGISVIECRKALEETKGDLSKAIKILKKEGTKISEKKKDRKTKEGFVGVYLHQNGKIAAMVKVFCESDFVAKNEVSREFAHNLAMQVAAMDPKDIDELLTQSYIKDVQRTVKQLVEEAVAKMGENIKIEEFKRIEI